MPTLHGLHKTLYLDHHHLYRDMLRESDGSLEVHSESNQEVDNSHQVL